MTASKSSDGTPTNRVTQILPATGWRAYEFTQDESGKTENREIPVIGWGLQENGVVTLLIAHPGESFGRAAMSIADIPSNLGEKYKNKVVHYQAVAPTQELADVKKEADFVLGFLRANKATAL